MYETTKQINKTNKQNKISQKKFLIKKKKKND